MLRTLLLVTAFTAAYAVAIFPRTQTPVRGEDITSCLDAGGPVPRSLGEGGCGTGTRRKSLPREEIDILARAMLGEGSGQAQAELEGIAHVVFNRLRTGIWGHSVTDVLLYRKGRIWAFTCFSHRHADPERNVWADHLPRTVAYGRMVEIIERAWNSDSDPTMGAVQYFHPKAMRVPGSEPAWAKGKRKIKIGEAIFLPKGKQSRWDYDS